MPAGKTATISIYKMQFAIYLIVFLVGAHLSINLLLVIIVHTSLNRVKLELLLKLVKACFAAVGHFGETNFS